MRAASLLLALLGTTASGQSVVRTAEVTYVLEGLSGSQGEVVLRAVRLKDSKLLWTAAVEPGTSDFRLVGPVLLTSWCFSGAYLACGVQAFAKSSGRALWQASGHQKGLNANFVLLEDDFFIRDDERGSLYHWFHVVRLRDGTTKKYTLRVPPREGCGGPVELRDVRKFSTSALELRLSDNCGTYMRTFR